MVPLHGDLVTTVDRDFTGSLDVRNIAGHVLRLNVGNRAVVGRRVDVSTLLVANALVLAVNEDVPDGGVGSGELSADGESEDSGGLHCEFEIEQVFICKE